ncbi:hypothetical protein [Flavobacterium piscis]|uniref:Uncharacterized protein n=1 Tax=Flavobacterium piscis TaxID=1114874 RepID=A0ABU1Y9Y6_9FLAO|nr:hypothetical protein [Flavobacterium piscis]MDR7211054.1 hypothetical protein [Flavobacterium piscis]
MAIEPNGNYGRDNRHSQSESQIINSETIENEDPAINQHDSSDNVNHSNNSDTGLPVKNSSEEESQDDNDLKDPFFQKNADIAQDLDEDLKSANDDEDSDLDFDQKDKSDL